ncbi:unnamed protein product [Nesidiocoris tenuis]|uniref:Reverse transcriptase domain-containing protein n=1 Tax=Nesidiocoris tenuis TaxID=355587 RepID=A0A6H5H0F7_9HEMI|nr:unnamed protein product [Nesidiocoris tenuis]
MTLFTRCLSQQNLAPVLKWYFMPLTVHKILYHSVDVIEHMVLPIGNLSEEAQEACNKDCRRFREFNTRNALKDISVPQNVKLVSYDVTSLFPSVPLAECKVLVKRKLQETVEDPTIQDEMMTLLGVCIDYNYFCFNGSYYRTQDGLAIGSPLSPLLAELFMDNLEQEFIFKTGASPLVKNVLFYKRYVDDSLALWRVPMEQEAFDSEINIIKQVAVNNGYEGTMVDTLVKVTRRKLDRAGVSKMQTKEPKKFRRMAYTGGTSEALMNDLKKAGIEPAPYTIGKLGRSLTNHKLTPRHDAMSSGVYSARRQVAMENTSAEHPGRLLKDGKSMKTLNGSKRCAPLCGTDLRDGK